MNASSRVSFAASRACRRWFVGGLLALLANACHAHDPGLSTAEATLDGNGLTLTVSLARADAALVWASRFGSDAAPGPTRDSRWNDLAQIWCDVRCEDRWLVARHVTVEALKADGVGFVVTYGPVAGDVTLVAKQLRALPPGHREFAVVTDARGRTLAQKFLTAEDAALAWKAPAAHVPVGATTAAREELPSSVGFLLLGIRHIWTGYDHLLFLLGLIVVCRGFRSIVGIISCFTLAHSCTLALATLHWVILPSRWVEASIAASIAFVGFENLVRGGAESRWRNGLTFALGLIHGFGFASALTELGVGRGGTGVLLPLFSFNLGVEIGQLVVAAVAIPLLFRLQRVPRLQAAWVAAVSLFVGAAGVVWFIQRAFVV